MQIRRIAEIIPQHVRGLLIEISCFASGSNSHLPQDSNSTEITSREGIDYDRDLESTEISSSSSSVAR